MFCWPKPPDKAAGYRPGGSAGGAGRLGSSGAEAAGALRSRAIRPPGPKSCKRKNLRKGLEGPKRPIQKND